MRFRTPVMIVLALAGGMVASMVVANLTGERAPEVAKDETTRIYVALRDIGGGEPLDERNVMLRQWPTRGLPPGAVRQFDELKSRLAAGRITAGQPIQNTHFQVVEVPTPATDEPSSPRNLTIEIAAGSPGPWVVSTGQPLQVTPLEEVWRQAIEVARRAEPDPVDPVAPATRATELTAPESDTVTSKSVVDSHPAQPVATGVAAVPVEQAPWMSSIVTPEGAKILRWRGPSSASSTVRTPSSAAASIAIATDVNAATNNSSAGSPGQRCDLVGHTLAGQPFEWNTYRGRPVLVVVYLARSSTCREELALVERLADAYRHRGLQVVGVGLDEDLEVVRSFARFNQLGWPNVVGPTAREWARASRLESALSLLVVSDEGRVTGIGHRASDVALAVASACSNVQEPLPSVREARRAEAAASQP